MDRLHSKSTLEIYNIQSVSTQQQAMFAECSVKYLCCQFEGNLVNWVLSL